MTRILALLLCFFSLQLAAQEQQLAYQYFRNGDYNKAAAIYKSLLQKNPYNTNYTTYLVDCLQQLELFQAADSTITNQLEKFPNQKQLLVELGYNYQLQHLNEKATTNYEQALKAIEVSPNLGYVIGRTFQNNHLPNYALSAYKKAMTLNPNANYNFQIAAIYGEKGELKNMFNAYLDLVQQDEKYISNVKSYIGKFITDDSTSETNILLKKTLLKRSQNNPNIAWNNLLSWLFMQQNEYNKALIQEKAIYKRTSEDLNPIITIGEIAFNNKAYEDSKKCFLYALEHTENLEEELTSKLYLLQIDRETINDNTIIEEKFQDLFKEYGVNENTVFIQTAYAEFLSFKKNETSKAIQVLKKTLTFPLNDFQKGVVKTRLADVYVYSNKFNTALIYYTQVQNQLKNHEIGQTARFKIAQTSFYKGDFEWAQTQLKVLKNSTSQLIANDALDLNLLITDNVAKDSLRTALKLYATADLLAFQNKNSSAIDTLSQIITSFKGHSIEDEALLKQAQLFEKTTQFTEAEKNYLEIIKLNKDDILADDAHYFLAELYLNKLNNAEEAKIYYQKIIFDYPASIYLVDARKKFRKLRGDELE